LGEYQEYQVAEGLTATKYVIGNEEPGGHDHVFYLRDHLPIATTIHMDDSTRGHAHSIEEGPGKTVIVVEANGHTHTNLVVEEPGDYEIRTLYSV
jgi:hypothetical protein